MNFLHWIQVVLHVLAFSISRTGGDRWDCSTCSSGGNGGPLNSPGAKALDTCAFGCLQAAPAGSQCENNPSSDCICNGAHYNLAIQAISSCAMASCNIVQDLAAATSVASTWCAQWSQTALAALVTPYTNTPTTTSLQTPSTTTNGQSGDTATNGVPNPSPSGKWLFNGCRFIVMMILSYTGGGNGGGAEGGLGTSDKIALGIGIGVGVPTVAVAIWQMLRWLREHDGGLGGSGPNGQSVKI